MKIIVLAYGDENTASTLFRFHAYREKFEALGHSIEFIYKNDLQAEDTWEKIVQADLIINQKCIIDKKLGDRIFEFNKPVIFDFDDAVWTRPNKPYSWLTQKKVDARLKYWISKSHAATVANEHLAEYAKKFTTNVYTIPMAVDTIIWKPCIEKFTDSITLGWIGAPQNLDHLLKLETVLHNILEKYSNVDLKIFCGEKPNWTVQFEHIPYKPGGEVSFVNSLDIGLLPLQDSPYSHGKSPIKALQYLSCGVPVVANVFGATAEILDESNCLSVNTEGDWQQVLSKLIENKNLRYELGRSGRQKVLEKFSLEIVFKEFRRLLEKNIK